MIRRLENICNQNLSGADALRRVFLDQLRELLEKTNRDADRIEGGRPDEDLRSLEERMKKMFKGGDCYRITEVLMTAGIEEAVSIDCVEMVMRKGHSSSPAMALSNVKRILSQDTPFDLSYVYQGQKIVAVKLIRKEAASTT